MTRSVEPALPHLSPRERSARGKAARAEVPRALHAGFDMARERPDPVTVLEDQASSRVQELVPIRYGRMSASPFAFFRGAAAVMAADLAATPQTGIRVQLCGDAHISNFGGFASPERDLVFDLNDFDETIPGPWEWDVKRFAASIAIGGRDRGFKPKQRTRMVLDAVRQYREAMRSFAGMTNLEIWYARLDQSALYSEYGSQLSRSQVRRFDKAVAKARAKDSARAFNKLATHVNGGVRINDDPPLIVPIEDLLPGAEAEQLEQRLRDMVAQYGATLPGDRRHLLDGYRIADFARKVVGVGSVGTRAWVLLLIGRDDADPLFLQAKEAGRSVIEPFAGASEYENMGQRVVEGQRLMQAASDIFLGWLRAEGIDGMTRDFYLRQLWDWKASADLETMRADGMAVYARLCGWTLARAHARSGDPIAIAAYLGEGGAFDRAIGDFAEAYADRNERDYAALLDAVRSGRVVAQAGI